MTNVLTSARRDGASLADAIDAPLLVVALCAAWCDTCREFQPAFARIAADRDGATFVWLDIEDDSELAGEIDVENFPTLAVFRHGRPAYFGVSLPIEAVVARLVDELASGTSEVSTPKEVRELPRLLADHANAQVR
jgi:thioredoxin 1